MMAKANLRRCITAALASLWALGAGQALAAQSAPHSSDNVTATLITDLNAAAPGDTVHVGLRLEHAPHWHTYWRNPGDSGEATLIEWTLPAGFTAGEKVWPAPKAIPLEGVLTNYGYEDTVTLLTPITVPANAPVGETVTLRADVLWLECKDICIPVDDVVLTVSLDIADASVADAAHGAAIAETLAAAPQSFAGDARITQTSATAPEANDTQMVPALVLAGAPFAGGGVQNAHFFPFSDSAIDHNGAQTLERFSDGVQIALPAGRDLRGGPAAVDGVVTFEVRGDDGAWTRQAVEIAASVGELALGAPVAAATSGIDAGGAGGLIGLLAVAFLGGLILNLMPCVFPVLSIKAAGFVGKAHDHAGEIRRHGLIFLTGVLTTFGLLGAVLAGVQAGVGGAAVYGTWLQNPLVVGVLAMVMFLIGLNLLGVFEVGTSIQGVGSGLASKSGDAGAFFTGVLAVVVGAPCIGPFLGAGLGLAFSQSAPVLIGFFLMMGLGLAAPFVALSFSPGLLRLLPKPGRWMEITKQAFAFPMFLTAVWLLWVLGGVAGADGVGLALLAVIAAGFLVWTFTQLGANAGPTFGAWAARGVGVVALIAALFALSSANSAGSAEGSPGDVAAASSTTNAWSPERVAQLQAEGRAVFIDFTADWCATCQVNKLRVLDRRPVREAFAAHNVTFLTADWTARDPLIAETLAKYGRAGVPFYLLIADDGHEWIFPEWLNQNVVIAAVEEMTAGAPAT